MRNWSVCDGFGPAERAVLSATDDSLATGTISDESWAACAEVLGGEGELIGLVAVIGNWMLFLEPPPHPQGAPGRRRRALVARRSRPP